MKTITLPNGNRVTLAAYVAAWKNMVAANRDAVVARKEYKGWQWFPVTAGEILSDISAGVHDRINRHLPWFQTLYKYNPDCPRRESRRRDKLHSLVARGLLKCECRWCGSALPHYETHQNRFCDASCRRSYNT
jgi:hypothetical protein